MHSHLRTRNHQRVTHVISCISHVYKMNIFQCSKMLTDRQQICQHLCRMILICQTIPYRHTCMFCQFFYTFLSESTIFDTIKHSSEYSCCIFNTLFLANLGSTWIQISGSHSHVMCRHFKRTSGSCTCLFKNKRNIHASVFIYRNSFFLLIFQICCQIQHVGNLFLCKIFQC